MPLTPEEQAQLETLRAKAEAPEVERVEHVEIRVDLSDPDAVRRAVALGYCDAAGLEELENGAKPKGRRHRSKAGESSVDEEDEDEQEDEPRRPKRRLNLAERTLGAD